MLTRRTFLTSTTLAAALPSRLAAAPARSAELLIQRSVKPVVISDYSGFEFTNGGPENCVTRAFRLITEGKDVLDALIAGVNIPELDPTETGIGYGALPNADGVVELDASCMHGPLKRAGAVASLAGRADAVAGRAGGDGLHRPPPAGRRRRAAVRAQHGLQDRGRPQHRELAPALARVEAARRPRALPRSEGRGAKAVPISHQRDPGLEAGLVDGARRAHSRGQLLGHDQLQRHRAQRRRLRRHHHQRPGVEDSGPHRRLADPRRRALRGQRDRRRRFDRPRRSQSLQPVLVPDRRADADGQSPKDAGMEALRRIKANTVEKRLLNAQGEPNFNIRFFALNKRGEYAGVAMYRPVRPSTRSAPRTARRRWSWSRCCRVRQKPDQIIQILLTAQRHTIHHESYANNTGPASRPG